MSRVLIVIPAWNEGENLHAVILELRRVRGADDVLVVDDGSTDVTAALARRLGCRVVELPFNLGYGGAVQTGVKYGLRHGYDVVVTFDGDGQHDPLDIDPLVEAVEGGADVVLGSRALSPRAYRGARLRRLGRLTLSWLTRRLTGLALTDPTSGLKALGPRGQSLFALGRFPDRFPDADALVLARRASLKLDEVPARMRPSRNRHSMHGGPRIFAYTFNMLFSLFVAKMGRAADLKV